MQLLTASYDVANRMVETQHSSAGTHRYHYNHANQRVMRYTATGGGYGGYQRRFSLYGLGGELLLEADLEPNCVSGCPTPADKETLRNVYFAGRKLFVSVNQWPLQAVLPNRLGSRSEHFPYGEQKGGAPPDGDRDYFTTYRRDETGLDYAWNRYYAPGVGRFTTADPYGGSARPEDPQSWNRYGYADNEPIGRTDPTGLYWWDPWSLMQGPSFPDWTGGWGGAIWLLSDLWNMPWHVPFAADLPQLNAPAGPSETPSPVSARGYFVPRDLPGRGTMGQGIAAPIIVGGVRVAITLSPEVGAVIVVLGEAITRMFRRGLQSWRVKCYVHPNGTNNHEAVGQVQTMVLASSAVAAIEVARPKLELQVKLNYGDIGFHLQHCSAQVVGR